MDDIRCPKCDSDKFTCYDETYECFELPDGRLFDAPVGHMRCDTCGAGFVDLSQVPAETGTKWARLDERHN